MYPTDLPPLTTKHLRVSVAKGPDQHPLITKHLEVSSLSVALEAVDDNETVTHVRRNAIENRFSAAAPLTAPHIHFWAAVAKGTMSRKRLGVNN